jgi:sirohydrochlorin cobaltochelatase
MKGRSTVTVDTLLNPGIKKAEADKRAPMAPAPMVYNDDNSVAWDRMWDNFCVLASAGGPPHRATLLRAQIDANPDSDGYRFATDEIIRGIALVSGLTASPATTGWIAIECHQPGKARWLSEQICQENVEARAAGTQLFVPVGDTFSLKGEIKNVITAVAKTTHYWSDHLAAEVKASLAWEEKFNAIMTSMKRWFRR